jgi:hypothetical protein
MEGKGHLQHVGIDGKEVLKMEFKEAAHGSMVEI